jgi:hypothetical protein
MGFNSGFKGLMLYGESVNVEGVNTERTDTLCGINTEFLYTEFSGACRNCWGFEMIRAFCVTYYFPILR